MRRLCEIALEFSAVLALAGCATAPTEPGILALPGSGKSLEQFQADEVECRGYASTRVSVAPASDATSYDAQRRYDFAFVQCMYAKGHKVPVSGGYTSPPVGVGPPPPGAPAAEGFIPPPADGAAAPAGPTPAKP
jgi:hypothetical protein